MGEDTSFSLDKEIEKAEGKCIEISEEVWKTLSEKDQQSVRKYNGDWVRKARKAAKAEKAAEAVKKAPPLTEKQYPELKGVKPKKKKKASKENPSKEEKPALTWENVFDVPGVMIQKTAEEWNALSEPERLFIDKYNDVMKKNKK